MGSPPDIRFTALPPPPIVGTPVDAPRLVYVALASNMRAALDGSIGLTICYNRPLQVLYESPSTPITITVHTTHPQYPSFVLPFYEEGSVLDARDDPDVQIFGGVLANLVFQLYPFDTTALQGLIVTCSNASVREGWFQFSDVETGEALPELFSPEVYTSGFILPPA